MKAAYIHEYGASTNFRIEEVDKPAINPNEVLVKVEAAGVIFSDVVERRGAYGDPHPPFPYALGWEVAGTVEKVGRDVTEFELGQRVVGTFSHGGYAEYAAVPARSVRHIPTRCSFTQALVYLVNLPVAYVHYYTFGQVQPGETILVHAASGGVGSMITQLAKRRGERNTVIALASTDEKLEFCKAMGADHLINYRKVDYVDAVKKLTDNRGVDVVCNSVGGSTLASDPKLIKPLTGRWLLTGAAAGLGTVDPY
jgi:NADPH2:quinone reductase